MVYDLLATQGYLSEHFDDSTKRVINDVFDSAEAFFRLPLTEKFCFAASETRLSGFRDVGIEYSSTPDRPDLNQTFSFRKGEVIAEKIQNLPLLNVMQTFQSKMDDYVSGLLSSIQREIGVSPVEVIETDNESWVQLNYYRPSSEFRPELQDAHEDGHIVTVAFANQPGLEFKPANSGDYVKSMNTFLDAIIMPGELLTILTDGKIPPLYHRVIKDPEVSERISLMYFVNPNKNTPPLSTWSQNRKTVDIVGIAASNPEKYGLPKL